VAAVDEPAIPRPAATVIVLRRGGRHRSGGLEVLMLRRGADARFMPGVWVFPGGAVDGEDRDAALGLDLGVESDEAAHRVCAARELGEEAALVLAVSELRPWSRWVTPEVVPIRFDTRFYVALAPPHSKPVPDRGEVDEARWLSPAGALEAGGNRARATGDYEAWTPN